MLQRASGHFEHPSERQQAGLFINELVTPGTTLTDIPWWNRRKRGAYALVDPAAFVLHSPLLNRKGICPVNILNILCIRGSSIMCSGTVHELFLSVSHFALFSREVDLFICMFCESNDAVGHNRRWHLLLMVTPAHGRPCGQAPGGEKLGGEEREEGDGKALLSQRTSKWKCLRCFLIIHANLKSRSELKPRRLGLSFALFFALFFLFLISHFKTFFFWDGSSVTTNALCGHDTNIQLIRGSAPGYLQWHYCKSVVQQMNKGVNLKGKMENGVCV